MKKQLLFTALALAAAFTGCSDEDNIPQSGENRVQLFIDGPASRVVTDGNATSFETGDQIVINSAGLAPDMENEIFTVGENGSLEANLNYYYDGNKSANFYAHYPTTATSSEGNVSITVPSIQQGEEQYNATDFMTATATGNANTEGGAVSLKFAHRLSLVKVVWEGSNTATDIEMLGIKPTVTWNYATDALTAGGTATNIVMWKKDTKKQEYWALIPAQTIAKGTHFLTIYDGSKKYPYTPNVDLNFNDKQVKKITLTTKEEDIDEAIAKGITIDDWTDDESAQAGDLNSVILPPDTLIYPDWGQFKDITALTALTKSTAQAGVWGFDADTDDGAKIELVTCPDDTNAKAIHINIPQYKKDGTTKINWWENAMYYQLPDSVARGIKSGKAYQLKFKARTSAADTQLRMMVSQVDLNNVFFGITNSKNNINKEFGTGPQAKDDNGNPKYENGKPVYSSYYWRGDQFPKITAANTYQDFSFFVNFAYVTTIANGSIQREEPGTIADFGHIALCFTVNAYSVDFWIKDITFEEYIPEN